jgi:hypothetical protein
MNKKYIFIGLSIFVIILLIFLFSNKDPNRRTKSCEDYCLNNNWESGKCEWPRLMSEERWEIDEPFPYSKVEKIDDHCVQSFLWMKSRHCGNKGQCSCYCFNYK